MPVHLQSASSAPRLPFENSHKETSEKANAATDHTAQKRESFQPRRLHPNTSFDPNAAQQTMEALRMNDLQSEFIPDTMSELRERTAKRQRTGDAPSVSFSDGSYDCGDVESGQFDIWDQLDWHPDVVRVVATAGGLITNWNEGFAGLTKPSAFLRKFPLTIFELVDSGSLPKLYGMLALALHDVGIVGVEQFRLDANEAEEGLPSSPSHLTITLPCKKFVNSSIHYDITVVYVPDTASTERCFLGILAPGSNCRDNDDSLGSGGSSLASLASDCSASPARGTATTLPRLPHGRILLVDDELLWLLLDPAVAFD